MDTAQLILNGAVLGASYALVALGFVLVLNATSAVNFAHGDLVMAGGLLAVALAPQLAAGLGVPGLALLPVVMALMAVLGLLVSLLAYFPLRKGPPVSVFISTIAVGIILQHGATAVFGPETRAAPPLVAGPTRSLGEFAIEPQGIATLALSGLLVGATYALLYRTQFGRRLRATAMDPEMARAVGVRTGRMIAASFALGASLAGAAGLMLANSFFVEPTAGGSFMIKAYIAVVIGGWGSVPGAVAGAFIIALFEVGVASWTSHPVAEAALYATLLLVLLVRPQGLFGETTGRRA